MAIHFDPRKSFMGPLGGVLIVLLAALLRFAYLDHLPPGIFYDESANGVDALRVLAGAHPIFFPGNQGREPLFIYLQAATIAMIGPSSLALRLPPAILGVLTVAATYTTFRAIFGLAVGAITATLLAVSYWHLSLSRLAFSAVGVPLFAVLAGFWYWKALHSRQLRHFGIAGLCLGVDLYTYIPSRLTPFVFFIWFLGCLAMPTWRKDISWRRLIVGGFVCASVFSVTIFPLARHFYLHPHDFLGRIQAERPGPTDLPAIAGFPLAAEALFFTGDSNPRHDLPGRPLVDPWISLAALLGAVLALRRWRDGASLFPLVWAIALLTPAALSREPAHALRLGGELPFILVLAAIGLERFGRVRIRGQSVGRAVVALALVASAASTSYDYFAVWATRQDTYDAFESDALLARALLTQLPPGSIAFATSDTYEGKSIPLAFIPRLPRGVRSFDGRNVFVTPAVTSRPVYYAYTRTFVPGRGLPTANALRTVTTMHDPFGRAGGILFQSLRPDAAPAPARPSAALIGTQIKVTGVDVQPVVRPGESVRFALYWTVLGTLPPGDWQFFAHLVDRDRQRLLGEDYNDGFPPDEWRGGDRVVSSFTIPVSADAPAGVADVYAGLFDRTTGRRVSLSDPSGQPAGEALVSGPVRIDRPTNAPPPSHPLADRFGPSIELLGYDLRRGANSQVELRLQWKADQQIDRDYTVFVHLVDQDGHLLTGADSEPGNRRFPTSTWLPGETVVDVHDLTLPSNQATPARIEVGLYLLRTGQRLPVFAPDGAPLGDSIAILL